MSTDSKAFIDRYDELAVVQALLDSLQAETPIQFPLREYVGIGGIGKTALLKRLAVECRDRSIVHSYIDYQDHAGSDPVVSLSHMLERMALDLLVAFGTSEATVKQLITETTSALLAAYGNRGLESDGLDHNALRSFRESMKGLCGVVIIDSLNLAPETTLSILGQEILFPLSESGRLLFLLGSRTRVDWGKPKYRIWRRTKSTALLTFPIRYTVEQVNYFRTLAPDIQRITCGHPEANDIVVQLLDHIQESQGLSDGRLGDYEARLIDTIVEDVIRERKIIPPDSFREFCVLSVLRYINLDLPVELLTMIDGAKNWTIVEVAQLIGRLQQGTNSSLIQASSGDLGYVINEFVRRSLSLYLRFFEPDTYIAISKIAVRYYERKFYENPTKEQFLIEKAYHYIDVFRMTQAPCTDLDVARRVYEEFKRDLVPTLGGPLFLARAGGAVGMPQIPQAAERQLVFDRLRKSIQDDRELSERLGDIYIDPNQQGFLLSALDDFWRELSGEGTGVLEVLKHYRPLSGDEPDDESDLYEVTFRTANEPIGVSRRMAISPQQRHGIKGDVGSARSKDDLTQLGLGLQALLPADLQKLLKQHIEPIVIDVNDTEIPWELIHDGRDFLALRLPLGKQIRSIEMPRFQKESDKEPRVLLIGVPSSRGASMQPLKYVEDEITLLKDFLGGQKQLVFDPAKDLLFDREADIWTVVKRLASSRYRIVHFAGHAVVGSDDQRGLLLYDGLLTEENIKSSLRGNPLIFVNACQSARTGTGFVQTGYHGVYMSGLASAFIIGGAAACIASLWEIQDKDTSQLALDFYEELAKGAMVGEALRRAKSAEYSRPSADKGNWASYVLFGNPTKKILG